MRILVLALVLSLRTVSSAGATIVNGSFETGTFAGWNTIGDASIQTAAIGIAPTDGTSMALLTGLCIQQSPGSPCPSALFLSTGIAFSGIGAVPSPPLLEFLGAPLVDPDRPVLGRAFDGDIGRFAHGGSGMKQTVVSPTPDAFVTFDAQYVSNDFPVDEAAAAVIDSNGHVVAATRLNGPAQGTSPFDLCHQSRVFDPAQPFDSCDFSPNRTTGWQRFVLPLGEPGAYTISFGIWNMADDLGPSVLFIDSVQLQSIPSPPLSSLLAAGLLILAARRYRCVRRPNSSPRIRSFLTSSGQSIIRGTAVRHHPSSARARRAVPPARLGLRGEIRRVENGRL